MSDHTKPNTSSPATATDSASKPSASQKAALDRKKRQEAALRENLFKRKHQARARKFSDVNKANGPDSDITTT